MNPTRPLLPYEPARCSLRLQGHINANWSDWLSETETIFSGEGGLTTTTLNGIVRDQAGLFGLLSFVRDLGAVLLAVEVDLIFVGDQGEPDE